MSPWLYTYINTEQMKPEEIPPELEETEPVSVRMLSVLEASLCSQVTHIPMSLDDAARFEQVSVT